MTWVNLSRNSAPWVFPLFVSTWPLSFAQPISLTPTWLCWQLITITAGLSIHTELKEQESILDDLENRTDYAVNNMEDVNRLVSAPVVDLTSQALPITRTALPVTRTALSLPCPRIATSSADLRRGAGCVQVKDMIKSKEGRNQLCLICMLTTGLVIVTSLIFIL